MAKKSTLVPVPDHAIDALALVKEASQRAADYAGMEESVWFLTEARRYLSLHNKVAELQAKLDSMEEQFDLVRAEYETSLQESLER